MNQTTVCFAVSSQKAGRKPGAYNIPVLCTSSQRGKPETRELGRLGEVSIWVSQAADGGLVCRYSESRTRNVSMSEASDRS